MNLKKLNAIGELFTARGYNVVVGTHHHQQEKWLSWYRGNVNDFHYYNEKIAGSSVRFERKTLGMAKTVCEDFASQIWNEDSSISVKDTTRNDVLQDVLKRNNMNNNLVEQTELYGALGNSLMVEFMENGETTIGFIQGEDFVITGMKNKKPTSILAINSFTKGDNIITHLTHHIFDDKESLYSIEHEVYLTNNGDELGTRQELTTVFSEEEVKSMEKTFTDEEGEHTIYIIEHETKTPFFQPLKPNIVNNFDIDSLYGISLFANSIDTLKSIDTKYDAYDAEFENGISRILVDSRMTETKLQKNIEQGTTSFVNFMDKSKRVYMAIAGLAGKNDDKDPVKFYNPILRENEISTAINRELSWLGMKALGDGNYYNFTNGIVATTATETNYNQNKLKTNIKKHRFILEEALKNMVKSIFVLEIELGNIISFDIEDLEIDINFSDSIMENDEEILEKKYKLNALNLYPDAQLVADTLNIGLEDAKEFVELSQAEAKQKQSNIFDGFEEPTEE